MQGLAAEGAGGDASAPEAAAAPQEPVTVQPVQMPPQAVQVVMPTATVAAPNVPEALKSPRATMATFLHAMNDIKRGKKNRIDDATKTLDLSDVNTLVQKERGEVLAWTLLDVMDRTQVIDLKLIPEKSDSGFYVFHDYKNAEGELVGDVRISRQADGRWLFDSASLAKLTEISDSLSQAGQKRVKKDAAGIETENFIPWNVRLRESLPAFLKHRTMALEAWQWIGIFVVITLSILADKLISVFLSASMKVWLRRKRSSFYRDISADTLRPFGVMVMAAMWWAGLKFLGLPDQVLLVLLLAAKFLVSLAGVWAVYRLVDLIGAYLYERAASTTTRLDDMLVPLFKRIAKICVTVFGIIFLADNMNIDITGLLAGLGLGGLAFALAAKDAVQNLFGSIMILMERTFIVGDWIRLSGAEGTVENIGFRSTRIRTFYNSLVTVPNSTFITAQVDNMGKRHYRRLKCMLSLTYDTPAERIEAYCEGLREIVRLHPYTRKDYFHIYFNQYSASSLDILVYVFFDVPDWATELRERHRFLLDALRLAQQLGVEFAFPTQTLYMRNDTPPGDVPFSQDFNPDMAQENAFVIGKQEAENIVKQHTGLGVKPAPVAFHSAFAKQQANMDGDGGEG